MEAWTGCCGGQCCHEADPDLGQKGAQVLLGGAGGCGRHPPPSSPAGLCSGPVLTWVVCAFWGQYLWPAQSWRSLGTPHGRSAPLGPALQWDLGPWWCLGEETRAALPAPQGPFSLPFLSLGGWAGKGHQTGPEAASSDPESGSSSHPTQDPKAAPPHKGNPRAALCWGDS